MQKKVLIAEKLEDICTEMLSREGIIADVAVNRSPQQLIGLLANGYHGLIVRSATKVTKEVIENAESLEIIGRAGAGVDTIDVAAATKKGILVCNTPYVNSISVAELVFGFMLGHARSISEYDKAVKAGEWPKGKLRGKQELYGKTLGIVGLGNIGKEVANRAESFGMQIIYFDPYVSHPNYKRMSVEDVFSNANIVTIHVPSMKETNQMIKVNHLFSMKKEALLINTARSSVIANGALEDVLDKRDDLLVALDVMDVEAPGEKPLSKYNERILLTPHIGASTKDAQKRGAIQIAEQFIEFFKHGKMKYAVNFVSVPDNLYPFLELSEKIAKVGTILLEEQPVKVEYTCYGSLDKYANILESALIKGIFECTSDINVNYVNAEFIAKQKGLVLEKRIPDNSKQYGDSITVDVIANGKVSIRGKVNKDNKPSILRIGEFYNKIDIVSSSQKALLIYEDKPGVVSVLGGVCEKYGINIDNLSVTHDKQSRMALAVLETNTPISEQQINEMKQSINAKGINVAKAKVIDF